MLAADLAVCLSMIQIKAEMSGRPWTQAQEDLWISYLRYLPANVVTAVLHREIGTQRWLDISGVMRRVADIMSPVPDLQTAWEEAVAVMGRARCECGPLTARALRAGGGVDYLYRAMTFQGQSEAHMYEQFARAYAVELERWVGDVISQLALPEKDRDPSYFRARLGDENAETCSHR